MRYRAVIFDLFDTLMTGERTGTRERALEVVAAAGLSAESWLQAMRARADDAAAGRLPTLRARVREALAAAGHVEPDGALADELTGLLLVRWAPKVYADVRMALAELRERRYRLGLISNLFPNEPQWVTEMELAPLFDALIFSCEVGMLKPEPAIYVLCAERMGVEPQQCVFVDDQPTYLAGAKAVGMTTAYIDRPDRDHPPEGEHECDVRVEGLAELVAWLGR